MTGETQRPSLTAKDVIDMLRRHYVPEGRPPAGIFAPEIQAPGNSGRRADLIWQGCTSAGGRELVGHEVKVSRADLLAELSDLAKSDPWQRYCDRWYLVVPDVALIAGLDLPPTWGVLTPPSGRRTRSMTVAVPAPKLKPEEQAPALYTLATWLHWRHRNAEIALKNEQMTVAAQSNVIAALRQQIPDDDLDRTPAEKRREEQIVERIISALGGAASDTQIGTWKYRVDVSEVIAVLNDVAVGKERVAQLEHRRDNVVADLRRMQREIARLLPVDAQVQGVA